MLGEMTTVRNPWTTLYVTTSATALVFLDQTVMPVALPAIQEQFHYTTTGALWLVNSYQLALISLLLIGGRLSDIFGKRTIYLWGLALFGISSIMAAMSNTGWVLQAARLIQGFGASLTLPTTAAILIHAFPPGNRAKAIGINTGISAVFLALGPVVGGFLTQYLSWHWIFLINIPIILFGMITCYILLPKEEATQESFHFLGAIPLVLSIVALIVALMEGNRWGWHSPPTIALFVMTPLLFGIFLLLSAKTKHPLIDFSIFKNRFFSGSMLSIFLTQIMITVTVLWALFFQQELGFSPAQAGGIILIATGPVLVMAPLAGILADRYGSKLPMVTGFIFLIISLLWLAYFITYHKLSYIFPGLILFGAGIPMIFSPGIALGLSHVPQQKLGASSGVSTITRQLASTIGIALMAAIFASVVASTGSATMAFSISSLVGAGFAISGLLSVIFILKSAQK